LPSSKPHLRLNDIVENARAILEYTAGLDEESFEESRMISDAVERCLERISEAASKRGDIAPSLVPDQPWPEIRALGNRLRHNYDEIGSHRIWAIIQKDLPGLMLACEAAIKRDEAEPQE
jgi:uncharacterized protein with HEPN domain